MASKVFISWSGELSKKLAEEIRLWLPGVLQFVKPYFTPNDIEKGTRWSTEIASELESSNVGIICLTKDNLNKPWILFEAGALSKNFGKSNVCTILFNFDSADFTGPLTSFQATKFDKTDFKKFLTTINNTGGESKLESAVLNDVFEMWWPKLESKVNSILKSQVSGEANNLRSEREILEEVLELTRLNSKRTPRRNDIARESIMPIFDLLQQMQYRSMKTGNKEFMLILDEFRSPLKRLCVDIDMIDMYERFMIRSEKYILDNDNFKIERNNTKDNNILMYDIIDK